MFTSLAAGIGYVVMGLLSIIVFLLVMYAIVEGVGRLWDGFMKRVDQTEWGQKRLLRRWQNSGAPDDFEKVRHLHFWFEAKPERKDMYPIVYEGIDAARRLHESQGRKFPRAPYQF